MRNLRTWMAAAAVALTLPLAVNAEDSYFGFNHMSITYDEGGFPEMKPTAIALRFGKHVSPGLAIEGRAGFGVSGDTVDVCGFYCGEIELELDNFFGAYLRGVSSSPDGSNFYGLIGMTRGKLSASADGEGFSESETDLSYGVGAELMMGKNSALNLEYLQAIDKDGVEVSSLNIGFVFRY